MKFAQKRLSQVRDGKKDQANAANTEARRAGLLPCGEASTFFRALGVGEERLTSFLASSSSRKQKIRGQWWAPADLVRLNRAMKDRGVSGKIRLKALRCFMAGKELPEKVHDAVAIYTESLFERREKNPWLSQSR